MSKFDKGMQLRKLPLCIAMLGCLYGTTAIAQDAPAQPQEDEKKEAVKELDKITAAGLSLIHI